jgi:hypothetical protein
MSSSCGGLAAFGRLNCYQPHGRIAREVETNEQSSLSRAAPILLPPPPAAAAAHTQCEGDSGGQTEHEARRGQLVF